MKEGAAPFSKLWSKPWSVLWCHIGGKHSTSVCCHIKGPEKFSVTEAVILCDLDIKVFVCLSVFLPISVSLCLSPIISILWLTDWEVTINTPFLRELPSDSEVTWAELTPVAEVWKAACLLCVCMCAVGREGLWWMRVLAGGSVKGGSARSPSALFPGKLCPALEAVNSSYICQAWEVRFAVWGWGSSWQTLPLEAQAAQSFLVLGKGGAGWSLGSCLLILAMGGMRFSPLLSLCILFWLQCHSAILTLEGTARKKQVTWRFSPFLTGWRALSRR